GERLIGVRVRSVSVLRTYDPPIDVVAGRSVIAVRRLGKRIVMELDDGLHFVVHLMVAGRLKWLAPEATIPNRGGLAAFDFSEGTLLLTEAGSKRRASIHLVGDGGLTLLDPGGAEIVDLDADGFGRRLTRERHTLKRTLTDPQLFAGIGGAFADEILWAAGLSPTQMSTNLTGTEIERLFDAAGTTLSRWTEIRVAETGDGFPTKVSAFHPDMAVHGKFERPCPTCGVAIQRIVHGRRETNYCPGCQTGGKILADRALSKLLKSDWPGSVKDPE
ncbi:MAG: DNA-formamidopyrimidine glycosylase family protein, partial [Actinomycetota bacterium]|nr:DNA-formamidopyrimidine glycosylase family protein [Actinomycetota bacterium]